MSKMRPPAPQPPPPPPHSSRFSSSHGSFFSSLKQVEKRLKLDSPIPSTSHQSSLPPIPPPPPPPPPLDSIYTATESLCSSIHLNFDQPNATTTTTNTSSEPPPEFLSTNPEPQPPQSNLHTTNSLVNNAIDDIDTLMNLLDLSDSAFNCNGDGHKTGDCCCCCEDVFYTKIVGAKGPKCGKEAERLNGWIKHFLGRGNHSNEKTEPFRLAHLLLAKAAILSQENDEIECFELPSTVDDFMRNNPPAEVE